MTTLRRLCFTLPFALLIPHALSAQSATTSGLNFTQTPPTPPERWTCSTLCGYWNETAVSYDPSQDLVIAAADTPARAYNAVKSQCAEVLLGEGKFRDRNYPILVVESTTSSGTTAVRATVANACVRN